MKSNRGTKEGGTNKTPKSQTSASKAPDSTASNKPMPTHARKPQHVGTSASKLHGMTGGSAFGPQKGT